MTSNDSTGTKVTSDDAERPDKVAVFGAGRPWANMSTKMNNNARLQREVPSQHINEKIPGAAYSDHNYISDSPTRMDLRAGISERVGERGVTNNALYGAESNTLKSTAAQRNAFGSKNGFANDGVSRSAQFAAQLQPTQGISNRNSAGISKNWKNSEEEEFMWDDVKSKLTESNILKKEVWAPDDSKKQVLDDHFTRSNGEHDIWSRVHRGTSTDSVSIAQSRETSFGKRVPSTWPSQDTHPVDGLNNVNVASRKPGKAEGFSTTLSGSTSMIPSSARVGLQPHTEPSVSGAPSFGSLVNLLSGSGGAFIQQGKHPLISTSLSVDSQSQNMSEQIYQQDQYFPEIYKRPPQHGGKLRLDPRLQTTNDAYSVLPNHILPGTTQHLEQDLQTSTSFMRSARGHQVQESQSEPTQSRPFGKPSNESSNCGTTSVSTKDSLLAAIMKSGLLSSHSLTGNLPNLNLQDSRSLPLNMNLSHSEPSEPPPRIATSSKGTVGLASVLSPPTAPGPPAHSLSSNASELADVTKSVGNPLSSLLSSLVAKGLISASSTESETERAPQVPGPLENKRQHLGRSSSTEAFTDPVSSTIPSSSGSELPVLKPASKNTIALSDVAMTEKTDLIGVEFRPDIIRELHPPVISSLFEDLLHQCSKCGARVRYQDQLDRHLELHNLKEHENSSSKRVSRTWFKRSEDWVSGKMEPSREVLTETSTDPLVKPDDKSEPVVPAVESQSACVICGEPFEDSYSHERDEWMYRGAVYLTTPAGGGKDGVTDESDTQGPIVHPNCISSSSAYELGLI